MYCSNCGEKVSSKHRFCSNCGNKLNQNTKKKIGKEENKDKVADYKKRLKKFNKFYKDEFVVLVYKYEPIIHKLIKKFENEKENLDRKQYIAERISIRCKGYINALSKIDVPEEFVIYFNRVLEEFSSFKLSMEKYSKKYTNYFEYFDGKEFNFFPDLSEIQQSASVELRKIYQKFNDEAEKLGLNKPFSE